VGAGFTEVGDRRRFGATGPHDRRSPAGPRRRADVPSPVRPLCDSPHYEQVSRPEEVVQITWLVTVADSFRLSVTVS
jgi:hypothetical protein